MIILEPTDAQLAEAEERANKMGAIRNSHYKGGGNFIGFVGEVCVRDYLEADNTSCKDYDITKDGMRIDVKTKLTRYPPKQNYACTIYKTSLHQQCDSYVFARFDKEKNKVYLCGWMPKKDFLESAHATKKGDVDPSNGYVAQADAYDLEISKLNSMESLWQ